MGIVMSGETREQNGEELAKTVAYTMRVRIWCRVPVVYIYVSGGGFQTYRGSGVKGMILQSQ